MWQPNKKHLIIIAIILSIGLTRTLYKTHFAPKHHPELVADAHPIKQSTAIKIHLAGAINTPGLYPTQTGTKLTDLIQIANGLHPEADLDGVDLTKIITKTQKIYIPFKERQHISKAKTPRININTATKTQLIRLPGVGESTARKIINYRTQNGSFKHHNQLLKIPGIGKKKLSSLKPYILL